MSHLDDASEPRPARHNGANIIRVADSTYEPYAAPSMKELREFNAAADRLLEARGAKPTGFRRSVNHTRRKEADQ